MSRAEADKRYRESHREQINQYAREHYAKPEIKEKHSQYYQKRYREDPQYRAQIKARAKPYSTLSQQEKDQLNETRKNRRLELRLSNPNIYSDPYQVRRTINIKNMTPEEFKVYKAGLWKAWAEKNKEKLAAYYKEKERMRKLTGYYQTPEYKAYQAEYYQRPEVKAHKKKYHRNWEEAQYAKLFPDIQADYELQNNIKPRVFSHAMETNLKEINKALAQLEIVRINVSPKRFRLRA